MKEAGSAPVRVKIAKFDSLTKEQIKQIMREVRDRSASVSRVAVSIIRRASCAS